MRVKELYNKTPPRAFAVRNALEELIKAGHGDLYVSTYGGTPHAKRADSNAAKHRQILKDAGYTPVAEAAGPGRRYKSEGHIVYVASRRTE